MSRFTINNNAQNLQKCWTHTTALKIIPKIRKQPNFFHSHPSAFPKDAPAISTTFCLSFMISFVVPTRSTFYAYLITKIENCNLNSSFTLTDSLPQWYIFLDAESNGPYLIRLVNELFQSTFIRKTHFGKIHWPSCHFSSCLGGCQILRTVYNQL